MARLIPDTVVVLLCPAFLECYNGWLGACGSDFSTDLRDALVPVFGEEFETPAVQGEDM